MKKLIWTAGMAAAVALMAFADLGVPPRVYKNLKVLPKDIQPPQMDSIMKSFNTALGVKCSFCHIRDTATKELNFALDGHEHKKIAREMLTMTQSLNRKYFGIKDAKSPTATWEVTCYTCHGGKVHPPQLPPAQPRRDTARKG